MREIPRMPAFGFLMMCFAGFWLLFANYPFGVMNPGSAIRYRTGYFILLLTILIVVSSRATYIYWRSRKTPTSAVRGRRYFLPRWTVLPRLRLQWRSPD